MIFRSALFHLDLLQRETVFWVFLLNSMWGDMIWWWMWYICSRKAGRNLKSNVSGFVKDFFVLKVDIDFRELIRKMSWRVWIKGVLAYLVSWKVIDYNVRKLSILWCLGCNWSEERLRGKVIRERKGFSKVWWHRVRKKINPFFILILFSFMVRFVKKK